MPDYGDWSVSVIPPAPGHSVLAVQVVYRGAAATTFSLVERPTIGPELPIRGGFQVPINPGETVTVIDTETRLGIEVHYGLYDAAGAYIGASDRARLTGPWYSDGVACEAWLRSLVRTRDSQPVIVEGYGPESRKANAGIFRPVNGTYPIVVSEPRSARTGTLNLVTLSARAADNLRRLITGQTVVQFAAMPRMGVPGGGWYGAIMDAVESRVSPYGPEEARRWALPWVEVAAPPEVGAREIGTTYDDLAAAYTDYAALAAEGARGFGYRDLLVEVPIP
jgi:hypothetical protein